MGITAVGNTGIGHCAYGVTVQAALPVCPMCGGSTWEPYAAARATALQ